MCWKSQPYAVKFKDNNQALLLLLCHCSSGCMKLYICFTEWASMLIWIYILENCMNKWSLNLQGLNHICLLNGSITWKLEDILKKRGQRAKDVNTRQQRWKIEFLASMTCVAFMTLIHTKCIVLRQKMPSTVAAVILIYQENSWDCQFICMGHHFLLTQFPCSELILRFMLSPFTKTFIKYLLYFSKVSGVFIKFWWQLVRVVCLCP